MLQDVAMECIECGGTNHGKCEIDANKDCAETLIYNGFKELNRLDAVSGGH
jgi:hypothetical protein